MTAVKWRIKCLGCGYSWQTEAENIRGLPPRHSALCPQCQDESVMFKTFELLTEERAAMPPSEDAGVAPMNTTQDAEKRAKTVVPIERDAVEHPSDVTRDNFERLVGGFAAMCVREGRLHKITLTISGYDSDPRELYEVPDVCAWARDTFKSLPSLWFFLDDDSQYAFSGWLCGPVARRDIQSRDFLQRLDNKRMECAGASIAASSGFLERAGASKVMVSNFYLQENRRAGKRKTMNFLHKLFGRKQKTGTPTSSEPSKSAQHEDIQQAQVMALDSARMASTRTDSTESGRWFERWLEQGGRGSAPCCANCRSFTIPLSGDHYCTMYSSQVDYLGRCEYWERRSD